jgi:hypothetical protein
LREAVHLRRLAQGAEVALAVAAVASSAAVVGVAMAVRVLQKMYKVKATQQ